MKPRDSTPLTPRLALAALAALLALLAGCQQITVTCHDRAVCRDIGQERGRQHVPVLNPDITNEGDVSGLPGLP